jgi:small GTP-binding protein
MLRYGVKRAAPRAGVTNFYSPLCVQIRAPSMAGGKRHGQHHSLSYRLERIRDPPTTISRALFSSRPEETTKGFQSSQQQDSSSDNPDSSHKPDALEQFMIKRRAAMKNAAGNASSQNDQNSNTIRNNSVVKEKNDTSGLDNLMKNMSEMRQQSPRVLNQNQERPSNYPSRQHYPNNDRRSNNHNDNSNYNHRMSNRFNNNDHRTEKTYESPSAATNIRKDDESSSSSFKGTSRLAELMQQLRQDSTFVAKSSSSSSSPKPRTNNNDFRNNNNNNKYNNFRRHDSRTPTDQRQQQRRPVEQSRTDFLSGSDRKRDVQQEENSVENRAQPPQPRVVTLPSASLTVTEASTLFRIKVDDIKSKLRAMGVMSEDHSNEEEEKEDKEAGKSKHSSLSKTEFRLDVDMMELLAMEFNIETTRSEGEVILDSEQLLMQQRKVVDTVEDDAAKYPPRPPVVTIMGHVDHGKTTLMDALRRQSIQQSKAKGSKKSSKNQKGQAHSDDVAGTEAGGITQIISAFEVSLQGQENKVTFLDTPGHAAFTAMRHSGTHAADVIVLVVAADDGISEQTIEIINLYKSIVKGSSESGISMVVALNKIDKPGIDVDEAKRRIENQLLEHGIIAEGMNATESEYGQPVQVIPTSGLTGQGLDDLMEGLLLQSEVMDLRADDSANAEGIVMDARMEKGLGVVVDCIIRWGNIKKGDVIISGDQMARVRMLKDVNDKMIKQGLPSQPVRIIGFKSLPRAGDPLMVVESEEIAEEILEQRLALGDADGDRPDGPNSDVELHIHGMRRGDTWRVRKVQEKAGLEEADGSIRIPIIVKADADGSLSAVRESLVGLGHKSKHNVVVDPVLEGIGDVTPSDIQMAKESEATIFAFGLKRIDPAILNLAESEGVQICSSDIIYSLLDTAQESLGSYLPPTPKEHIHGRAVVKAIFTIDTEDGKEKIAGMSVLDGHVYKAKAPSPDDSEGSSSSHLKCHFRVFRDGKRISPEGDTVTASSLRRFKESVDSVRRGDECGLGLIGYDGFQEGDEIECYSIEMKKGKL